MVGDWAPSENQVHEIVEKARAIMGGPEKVAYQVRLLPDTNSDALKRIELVLSLTVK